MKFLRISMNPTFIPDAWILAMSYGVLGKSDTIINSRTIVPEENCPAALTLTLMLTLTSGLTFLLRGNFLDTTVIRYRKPFPFL